MLWVPHQLSFSILPSSNLSMSTGSWPATKSLGLHQRMAHGLPLLGCLGFPFPKRVFTVEAVMKTWHKLTTWSQFGCCFTSHRYGMMGLPTSSTNTPKMQVGIFGIDLWEHTRGGVFFVHPVLQLLRSSVWYPKIKGSMLVMIGWWSFALVLRYFCLDESSRFWWLVTSNSFHFFCRISDLEKLRGVKGLTVFLLAFLGWTI